MCPMRSDDDRTVALRVDKWLSGRRTGQAAGVLLVLQSADEAVARLAADGLATELRRQLDLVGVAVPHVLASAPASPNVARGIEEGHRQGLCEGVALAIELGPRAAADELRRRVPCDPGRLGNILSFG